MKEDMDNGIKRLNATIEECEQLREEWKRRIQEVDMLKDTYETLIKLLRKQLNTDWGQE